MKCYYDDEEFGRILIFIRRDAKVLKFSWKNGMPQMTVPYGVPADEVLKMLNTNRGKIRQLNKDSLSFFDGQVIPCCFGFTISISTDARLHNQIACGRKPDAASVMYVHLPADADFGSTTIKRNISSVISRMLGIVAQRPLISYAWTEAARLGLHPHRFEIGRGKRKLGHCTSHGVIQLSRFLMLMPQSLVQYVVCHELAHLTHHDHSPAFYALLDTYLDGRSAELDNQINHFSWPIVR